MLTKGSYEKDPEGVSYDFISLVLGGPERDVEKMPEICSIPISYSDDESAGYGYIIPYSGGRLLVCAMNYSAVLDINLISHFYEMHITAYHSIKPNTALITHGNFTNNSGIICYETIVWNLRMMSSY
jgi:hypothetical protein